MKKINPYNLFFVIMGLLIIFSSCTGKISANIYKKEKTQVDKIHDQYKKLNAIKPFSVEFGDRRFEQISFEIPTDSLRYIYKFKLKESNLADTLDRYGYQTEEVIKLIADMRDIRCTWINTIPYYVNRERKQIINLSVRAKKWNSLVKAEKYYTIAYFEDNQFTDEKGRLLEKKEAKKPMKINNAVYRKITDKVFYAITDHFR